MNMQIFLGEIFQIPPSLYLMQSFIWKGRNCGKRFKNLTMAHKQQPWERRHVLQESHSLMVPTDGEMALEAEATTHRKYYVFLFQGTALYDIWSPTCTCSPSSATAWCGSPSFSAAKVDMINASQKDLLQLYCIPGDLATMLVQILEVFSGHRDSASLQAPRWCRYCCFVGHTFRKKRLKNPPLFPAISTALTQALVNTAEPKAAVSQLE